MSFLVDMVDVSLELLDRPKPAQPSRSLARSGFSVLLAFCKLSSVVIFQLINMSFVFPLTRFDFMKSKLLFESFSNGSKSVNLVSHSLLAYDTRYTGPNKTPAGLDGTKPNVFDCILQPSRTGTNRASLQLELHYRYQRRPAGPEGAER